MILGAQFYTLRQFCKDLNGLEESMKRVADMGYTSIQLSGTCAYEGEWAAEKARENGLTIDVTHYDYKKICFETEYAIKEHDAMNCRCIGIGGNSYAKDREGLEKLCADIAPAIEKIAASGHKFMYHNHHFEFNKFDGKTYLEHLCDRFSPDKLGITLDTFWVQVAGGDPTQWIHKMKGRLDRVHFKDMAAVLGADPDNRMNLRRIAPIGDGLMNYDAIIQACLEENVEIGYVELDECYGDDPFECMKKSYDFLNSRYGLK